MKTILALCFFIPFALAGQQDLSRNNDIDYLLAELEVRHANLYHRISKSDLHKKAGALKSKTGDLSDDQFMLELEELISSIGDGHTTLIIPSSRSVSHKRLPFRIYRLESKYIITSTTESYRHLVGKVLTKINGVGLAEIEEKFKNGIAHDNEFTKIKLLPEYLVIPSMLFAKGIIKDTSKILVTVESLEKKSSILEVLTVTKQQYTELPLFLTGSDSPLWLQNRGKKFWMDSLHENRTLYIQLNSSDIGGLEAEMRSFANAVVQTVSRNKTSNVVLDLRKNRGGSIWRTKPLLNAFVTISMLDSSCRLFVVTSTATFSAAVALAALINDNTPAVFIGEPTGGSPNGYGDIGRFTLPNTKLEIRYSRLYVQSSNPYDTRPAIFPDIPITYNVENFFHSDPAMDAVLLYRPPASLYDRLAGLVTQKTAKEMIAVYENLKKDSTTQYRFNETVLAGLARAYQEKNRIADAVRLLEFNTTEYPWSGYAHYVLAEAYLLANEPAKAKEAFHKAFSASKYYSRWADLD
ncbi:MAG TPA: hypothetical protein VD993_00325 [Chitinophagaceae bacterium]|nr:hypothetical protein [Chitinophagaceae bacterium]